MIVTIQIFPYALVALYTFILMKRNKGIRKENDLTQLKKYFYNTVNLIPNDTSNVEYYIRKRKNYVSVLKKTVSNVLRYVLKYMAL